MFQLDVYRMFLGVAVDLMDGVLALKGIWGAKTDIQQEVHELGQ